MAACCYCCCCSASNAQSLWTTLIWHCQSEFMKSHQTSLIYECEEMDDPPTKQSTRTCIYSLWAFLQIFIRLICTHCDRCVCSLCSVFRYFSGIFSDILMSDSYRSVHCTCTAPSIALYVKFWKINHYKWNSVLCVFGLVSPMSIVNWSVL